MQFIPFYFIISSDLLTDISMYNNSENSKSLEILFWNHYLEKV